jgi:hypothetical protein
MRFGSEFLSAFFLLLFAGLSVSAQTSEISCSPRELGTAVLREVAIQDGQLRFRVDSNGCTDAGSFKVRVRRSDGRAPKTAHYQLTIERVRSDECKAILWEGVVIEMDLAKDLGLKGKYTALVTNPVLASLLAATLRAGQLELEAARRKQKSTENLEAEQAQLGALSPEEYPAPVMQSPEPGSVLEAAAGGFGPVLPPVIREVTVNLVGPVAEGDLLEVEGGSRSGPFYHLAGIAGGDYGLLKADKKLRLELCLVYRREYFGFIGDFYVYVLSVR